MFLHSGEARLALRLAGLLGVGIAILLLPPPSAAQAQGMGWLFGDQSPGKRRALRPRRPATASQSVKADDKPEQGRASKEGRPAEGRPAGPLFAVVSLSDQHVSIYNGSGLVTRSKVSTGMPGHATPMGIFTIIGRERFHRSNIYSGAPMPYMQRITWSGVAMHLGVVPNHPASHGCIRLPSGSAERLWGLTKIGERVVISPHEVAPTPLAHPRLPLPRMQASPLPVADASPTTVIQVASSGDTGVVGAPKLLNPLEFAQALKSRAAEEVASASKAVEEQAKRNGPGADAIRRAVAELRAAEAARIQAETKFAARAEALATKRDASDIRRAEAAKAAAEAQLAATGKKVQAALDSPAFADAEGQQALQVERALIEARVRLAKSQSASKDAERRLSPVSVLVSKKDGKVYVRQGLAPVMEAPVTIRDPETSLGTHVYIATSSEGSALGWSTVSFPAIVRKASQSSRHRNRGSVDEPKPDVAQRVPAAASAAQALERIELPADVSARISERLWVGGSLIITDQALSDETSDVGTDLTVSMR
jgi:L,D-transpeptidase catalytic domain